MKAILFIKIFLLTIVCSYGQNTQASVSKRITDSMSDSLKVSVGQEKKIYQVNILLSNQKDSVRKMNLDPVQLQRRIQAVENTRDSMYRDVLNTGQYEKYRRLKASLISVKTY